MILGQTRTPFDAPGMPTAKLPHTAFYSGNIWPFSEVTNRMRAYPMYRPPLVPTMGPQMLPPVPPPPPPPAPNGAPAAATQVPSSAPTSAAMHGSFGGAGFGSTGGTKAHFHVDPYMVMRSGWIPGVSPSGSNIRAGVHNAGARIHRSMPFQTAPLPPPPPPPMPPAPMPTATHGFGRHKRRHWLSRMVNPETVNEVASREASNPNGCETYPPRADGIKVTVCNGRVVKYEDAQGNVNTPDPQSGVEYGSGGMAGFGYSPWGNRWGNRGGAGGGWQQRQYAQQAYGQQPAYGAQPGGFRHHRHHWWESQQPAYTPPPAAPAFGRW